MPLVGFELWPPIWESHSYDTQPQGLWPKFLILKSLRFNTYFKKKKLKKKG